ncbi:MAG: glutamate-5-semialdehyde dehydrogenase [Bacteroidales bacterium]|nr:glutamate-5-semialdehyde dehydrogenase [Bacteroidales bacterium]MCF8390966.1 glutamate-5-semialdehyde dehydrogenase [Bacteroidales bacterium]
MEELVIIGIKAKIAAKSLGTASSSKKNAALQITADNLIKGTAEILSANETDIENANISGLKGAIVDRLLLTEERIVGIADALKDLVNLEDPVGEVISMKQRPNGLKIGQKRVPIGVIGMIYESRPNVTADVFGLCIKTGNVVILRGGKEAFHSNYAIVNILRKSLKEAGLPEDSVQLIQDTSRESAVGLMKMNEYLDLLIPRGGAGLIQSVVMNSTVPVIETGVGNCHIYVDEYANHRQAIDIVFNAKTHRPGVCNAAESLIIHSAVAKELLPSIAAKLQEKDVEIRGDKAVCEILSSALPATEEDWGTEYLDYIISAKVVDTLEEAMEHIEKYGTKHSEAIITENYSNAQKFLDEVDSAAVYVNASTRFTDGYEFGFGAEIGISTQKLHARGPMGLKELTTTKYIIYGSGQIRE